MIYMTSYNSPLGSLFLAERDETILGLWITGQKYFLSSIKEPFERNTETPLLRQTKAWLNAYFAGKNPSVQDLPLCPEGSPFQHAVWRMLLQIPYGRVTTYGAIAKAIFSQSGKMSAQAVGSAVGHNPISILIPCHRVVGANGKLTGYAGGLDKKEWLLRHEHAHLGNGCWELV